MGTGPGFTVKRVVANLAAPDVSAAGRFYRDVLGLDLLMDHGWIQTWGNGERMALQLSVASEGGSGTPVPALSIEVDDVDAALQRVKDAGLPIDYGPVDEPWGVRRFFVREPSGHLVNVLQHLP